MVANEGIAFDETRIESLTRLGGSSKSRADGTHHTIGYKGIGFTSVFQISERPQILSDGLAFGFDRHLARQAISRLLGTELRRVPARYFPFLLAPDAWAPDEDVIEELFADGAVTVIRLPFREGVDREAVDSLLARSMTGTALLMMPSLKGLDVNGKTWTRTRGRKIANGQVHHIRGSEGERESWLIATGSCPIEQELVEALEEEVWKDVRTVNASVGIPWKANSVDASGSPKPMYVFFPTEDTTGRKVLLHGDFMLESSRKHIQDTGSAGLVSERVAELAAEVLMSLVEQLVRLREDVSGDLLSVLAPAGPAAGFGETLNSTIDERLAGLAIVPLVGAGRATPGQVKLLESTILGEAQQDLEALLRPREPLAVLSLGAKERRYLKHLGAQVAVPAELVAWFVPGRRVNYDRTVRAVAAWVDAGSWQVGQVLPGLPFVQATDGSWRRPREVSLPIAGVPALPAGLERATFLPPKSPVAQQFIKEHCPPPDLDLAASLEIVLSAVASGRYGGDGPEAEAVLGFVRKVWRADRSTVKAHPKKGHVRVPARRWRRGSRETWHRADQVYFSREWTGSASLETVMRRVDARFLAFDPPKRSKQDAQALFRALGVASSPRVVPVNLHAGPEEWRRLIRQAEECPEGHPQSGRSYEIFCVKNLDKLLVDLDARTAAALVELLTASKLPYGLPAKVQCSNSTHRRGVRGIQETTGLQRWLLENRPWIPVDGDPFGVPVLRPADAWTDVNGRALRAVLPRAAVSAEAARSLGLPRATSPDARDLVRALRRLHKGFPDLGVAPPQVIDGAFALLGKLNTALARAAPANFEPCSLPAILKGEVVWSRAPRICDLEAPVGLPVPSLPSGVWEHVARAFGLGKLSEELTRTLRIRGRRDSDGEPLWLSPRHLPTLVAAIHARDGTDLKQLGHRFGTLRVATAESLVVSYELADAEYVFEMSPPFVLEPEDSGSTLVHLAQLADSARPALSRLLADYSGTDVSPELFTLYLTVGPQVELFQVSAAQVDEAAQALARYVDLRSDEDRTPPNRTTENSAKGSPSTSGGNSQNRPPGDVPVDPPKQPPPVGAQPSRPVVRVGWRREGPLGIAAPSGPVRFDSTPRSEGRETPKSTKPSGARGGSGSAGFPSLSTEERAAIEARSMEIAQQFASDRLGCLTIRDVHTENKGWDLEFDFGGGRWWPVEVKGSGGSLSSFMVTRNERRAAEEQREYRFLLVSGTTAGAGRLAIVRPGAWLTSDSLQPMSWVVDEWSTGIDHEDSWAE